MEIEMMCYTSIDLHFTNLWIKRKFIVGSAAMRMWRRKRVWWISLLLHHQRPRQSLSPSCRNTSQGGGLNSKKLHSFGYPQKLFRHAMYFLAPGLMSDPLGGRFFNVTDGAPLCCCRGSNFFSGLMEEDVPGWKWPNQVSSDVRGMVL